MKKASTGARKRLLSSWEKQHVLSKNRAFDLIPTKPSHLRPLLDVGWTCTLLPHTVGVSQEEVVGAFTKAALGEQLAAADVHRKPRTLQQDVRRSFAGLHHQSSSLERDTKQEFLMSRSETKGFFKTLKLKTEWEKTKA